MDEKDLAVIRKRTETYAKTYPWKLGEGAHGDYIARDRAALMAEVDRLRSERLDAQS